MAVGVYALEVDWTNNGTFGEANEDITSYMIQVDCQRGRDRGSQLTGRSSGGRLVARLNNTSGIFASFNVASPIYGNIKPNRRCRLRMTSPTSRTLWQGWLDRIVPAPAVGRIPTVELTALGSLARINQDRVNVAMATGVLTGTAVGTVLDAIAWATSTNARKIDLGQLSMTRWWVHDQVALAALRDIEDSENGFLYEDPSGAIGFLDRQGRLIAPYSSTPATFSDASAATGRYSAAVQHNPLAEIYNWIEAGVRDYTTASGGATTLWTLPESTAGSRSPGIEQGATKTFWALYPNPQSPTQAIAVDPWTTPSTVDYAANAVADGSGADKTANVVVTATKYATRMRLDVVNNDTVTVFLTRLQARGVPVNQNDPVRIVAQDSATSQVSYGLRRYTNPGPWMGGTSYAEDWVNWNLGIYKDPTPFLSLTIRANKDSSHLTQAATRDLSERIRVIATGTAANQAYLGINQDFFIENIRHQILRNGGVHNVTWELSPVDPGYGGGFWVLDVSALDTETRLAI